MPTLATTGRDQLVALADQDLFNVPDPAQQNLGYGVGAGAFRLSPHALNYPERFGPLTWNDNGTLIESQVSDVLNIIYYYSTGA